jgi:hypothetical protein
LNKVKLPKFGSNAMVPVPVGAGPKKRKRRRVCSIWNFALQSRAVYLSLESLNICNNIGGNF